MNPNNTAYDPLDYSNLTINLVRELMSRGPFELPLKESFAGPGVYALFYRGSFNPYAPVASTDAMKPIYVGKAVLPGARKGGSQASAANASLFGRIKEHVQSISSVNNLRLEDFTCRYLVVVPLWITMAERFLIEHYQPLWNVCIEGFGLHDPGSGRRQGEISWWDALHRGRAWAEKQVRTRSEADATKRLTDFFKNGEPVISDRLSDDAS
jgi:hypothetical protein